MPSSARGVSGGRGDDLGDQGKRPPEVARGIMEARRKDISGLDGGFVRYIVELGSIVNGKVRKVTGEVG